MFTVAEAADVLRATKSASRYWKFCVISVMRLPLIKRDLSDPQGYPLRGIYLMAEHLHYFDPEETDGDQP